MNMLMVFIGIVLGGVFAFLIQKFLFDKSYQDALFNKDSILKNAKEKAESILKDAKIESEKFLVESKKEIQSQKDSLI